ncbi:hypothetical protein CVIRNUC_008119 [Coccomyxa viridis]|uniref:Nuclear cap-binding protein subunit 3 n=1 Tax=Coccomyxa viridis TaxID=1274662 RepID=A0AAV1ICZ7_9CHLO|nr:hypothetical protein CVIRNUC_008119 [Coccomyxa viridis]
MTEGPMPIVFQSEAGVGQEDPSVLDEERERHRKRAERFGTQFVEPGKRDDLRLAFRKEKLKKDGFKTGIDIYDEAEMARKQQRAARFGTENSAPMYAPAEIPEDEVKKQQRAERFGTDYKASEGLMDIDVLEERKEHGADIPRRPEAIHLYGVDCMSTSDCLAYFGDYGPTFVEWIDDSSCNVLFEDEFTTKRALIGRGKPLPPDNSAPDTAGLDPSDINNAPFLWHKGEDFRKAGTDISLMYRMATSADVKPPKGQKLSRYLWKMPVKRAQKLQKRELRQQRDGDGEDVRMGSAPRNNQRKRRKGAHGDVEMADAEDDLDKPAEEAEPGMEVPRLDIPDLRQILRRQEEPRAAGLFSAADFIALDGEDGDDAAGASEGGDAAKQMETEKAANGVHVAAADL